MSDNLSEKSSSLALDGIIEEQQLEKRVDQKIASDLAAIFNQLDRLITMMRVYPKGHPILDEIAQGIVGRLRESIQSHGDLEIQLGARELKTAAGTEFFSAEAAEKKQFIYYNAYADGVVRFTFLEGLTSKELQDFLGIVNRAAQGAIGSDDDTVTLLWELDLDHITYAAVEGFVDTGAMESFGDMNEAEATNAVVDASIEPRGEAASKLAQMFNNLNMVHLDVFTRMQIAAQRSMAAPKLSDQDLSYAFGVDESTIDKLMAEWASGIDLEYRLIEALLSIVRVAPQSEEGQKAAALITQVTHNLLDKEMFAQAARVLELLHNRRELFKNLAMDPVGELIDELSDPLRLEALLYMMQTNTAKREELVALMLMLGPAKVQWQILTLLADEKRKVVAIPQMVDVLFRTHRPENEGQFVEHDLTKSPVYFTRLLPVLADRAAEFKPMPRLIRAALQLDNRDAMVAAMNVEHPVWGDEVLADKYLQPMSGHDDEEVRKLALKRLGEHHVDRFQDAIRDSVLARKFKGRTHAELRFLMRVFLESSPVASQSLRDLLKTRGWFNKAHREFAKMAGAVLMEASDTEAIAFIETRVTSFWTHPDLKGSWKQSLARFAKALPAPEEVSEADGFNPMDPLKGVKGRADSKFAGTDANGVFYADGAPSDVSEDSDAELVGVGKVSNWQDAPGIEALDDIEMTGDESP